MSKPGDQHPTPVVQPAVALTPPSTPSSTRGPAATRPTWVMSADPARATTAPVAAPGVGRRRVIVAVALGLVGAVVVAGGIAWVALRGPDPMDLYLTAKGHVEQGEPTQALALIERGRREASDPRVIGLLTQLEGEIAQEPRLKIAKQLLASRQLAAAEQVLQEALKAYPSSDRARALLETVRAATAEQARGEAARPVGAARPQPASAGPPATVDAPAAAPRGPAAAGRSRRAAPTRGRAGAPERAQPNTPAIAAALAAEAPPGPPPGTTVVQIRASETAVISVDGQATGKTTPTTLYLAPGMHRIEARGVADPTLKIERRIMVTADAPATVDLQLPARAPNKRTIETANPYGEEK
ncbi:MAG: hypothetical protein IPG96_04805 [Proteobacteria bacterium]|nr:hypothetical protein [Pseudomonadota bacterium]